MRILRLITLFLLFPLSASAQFFVTGDDPGRLKWNFIDTESYRVIYPQGADSLANIYGRKLEKYKIPISRTSGYMTGDGDGKIMPVVLHAHQDANGSVAWAPKRMDLFSVPSAYEPVAMPWSTMLSVHESRHVTQMQFGQTEKHRIGKWILGEGWNMIAFLLYPNLTSMEGDAVVMETALTPSGRGRTADFLNYYWVAFDQGDFRKWFKWRFVSQLRYSPTYYALGYMTIGGYRYLYDQPYFVSNALHYAASHSADVGCLESETKRSVGKKWGEVWSEVCDTMYGMWKEEADRRAPYIPYKRVIPESKRYTDYVGSVVAGSDIYAIKKGHVDAPTIVRIDSEGKEHRISSFAYAASDLKWDAASERLYWSESMPDERWSLKSDSKIRYMKGANGIKKTLKNKALLYNPAQNAEKTASVRYYPDGHSSLDLTSSEDGKTMESYDAPDSLQLVETAWIGDNIYVTAISDNGYGIYRLLSKEGKWSEVLAPQPVMIKDFRTYGNELVFTCDRTGVNELYHLNPVNGNLIQKTSTRYGAEDFQYSADGRQLYYSSQTMMGKHLFKTPSESLLNKKVRFDSLYKYPVAEKLTIQEKEAAKAQGYADAVTVREEDVKLSDPKRYRKVPNMLKMHTWFPAYVSVDNIMNNMSFDPLWQALSLGLTGVMQNHLATATGEVGYSAHKDPYNAAKWRHSGHLKFTYSGLYPIFQFAFDINDRGARQYSTYADIESGRTYMVQSEERKSPYIQGKVSMYIPFNLTSGGWNKGIVPKFTYIIGNDRFDTGLHFTEFSKEDKPASYVGYKEGKNWIRQSVYASLRGYTMLSIANSQVYPRWGIGAEAGVASSIESYNVFSPMGYAYGYGYVPGFMRTHGMKLTAMWQTKLREDSPFSQQVVDILPRGLNSNPSLGSHLSLYNSNLVKVTADYAIPIYIGDVTLGGNWLAIKRLVTYPHFDYTFAGNKGLWSAGLDLTADLHAIITLEVSCSFGLSFSWNGGNAWKHLEQNGISMDKWFLGPIFNVSF